MTSEYSPLTPDDVGRFNALCDEWMEAREDCDGDRGVRILESIARIHPALSTYLVEGMIESSMADLATRMGSDDPQAYAAVRDLTNRFGENVR